MSEVERLFILDVGRMPVKKAVGRRNVVHGRTRSRSHNMGSRWDRAGPGVCLGPVGEDRGRSFAKCGAPHGMHPRWLELTLRGVRPITVGYGLISGSRQSRELSGGCSRAPYEPVRNKSPCCS